VAWHKELRNELEQTVTGVASYRADLLSKREELDLLVTLMASKRFFWLKDGKPINYNSIIR
jgi:hypothetical protein